MYFCFIPSEIHDTCLSEQYIHLELLVIDL